MNRDSATRNATKRVERGEHISERIITQEELLKICPFSRATIWRWEQKGDFPKRRRISRGRIGWLYSEIESHLTNLPKSK